MIDLEDIISIPKSDLQEASKALSKDDISKLVEWLSSEDDSIRCLRDGSFDIAHFSRGILSKRGDSIPRTAHQINFVMILYSHRTPGKRAW